MATLDFSRRALTPELMDTEDCGFAEFRACLIDLARVNQVTLTYRPTLAWLDSVLEKLPVGRPLRILDIGSGYGDMLRRIARWAEKRKIDVHLTGLDLNPWSKQAAEQVDPMDRSIHYLTTNLFDYRPDTPPDLVISSQFTHHLTDPQLVDFLQWMEQTATTGWFISDLHRHFLPYYVFQLWSRLARWHWFVQNDGPISITRSFVTADWIRLLTTAGLDRIPVTIKWWMPFRLSVGRIK